MPAIYDAEYPESGGLMSYSPSLLDMHRSAAIFVGKIIRGAKPADLPTEQPTRFKLLVNRLRTQSASRFPPSCSVALEQVIE